ncbi:MAG: 16S rRNA (uracil(1498)-N(3))-methyltransferase [Chloroflexi bacterium]|nr:16S rRNA (uracil(1498)-N(3))-methyltransferase [Chloroflexota bacterium]
MTRGFHRFFVQPDALHDARPGVDVVLTGSQAHQISRVLRLKSGQQVVLLAGDGQEHLVRLTEVRSSTVVGTVESVRAGRPEPRLTLTLYQALVPRERFETVLQKGSEVGVARFVPTWCERSIVPRGEAVDDKRLERWRRVVTEAAEQCERSTVPEVGRPAKLADALAEAAAHGPVVVAWERESERGLREVLRNGKVSMALFVGPEGGFSGSEIELARRLGALTVSLGPRILRTETAGPILAALALYEAGDLEPPPGDTPAVDAAPMENVP